MTMNFIRATIMLAAGLAIAAGCTTRRENPDRPADTLRAARSISSAGITFDPATPSILDPDARIFVDSPAVHSVVHLHGTGNGTYLLFDADVQGFALAAETRGASPCDAIDTGKGNGQYIYVEVDHGTGRVLTQLPAQIPVEHPNDSGPHTIRAFMCRSWEEGLKQTDASRKGETDLYCVRTFYIGTNDGTEDVDSTLPLLTLNAPLDSAVTTYPSNQILLDFHLTFRTFADGYRLEATLLDSTGQGLHCDTLNQWVPYCINGLSDPPAGRLERYRLRLRILDAQGNPVHNGTRYDMNMIEREFCVRPQ